MQFQDESCDRCGLAVKAQIKFVLPNEKGELTACRHCALKMLGSIPMGTQVCQLYAPYSVTVLIPTALGREVVEAAPTREACGEVHRIGWGPEMLVCYCTDGLHASAMREAM
jgi:hypothetical protein